MMELSLMSKVKTKYVDEHRIKDKTKQVLNNEKYNNKTKNNNI